MKGRIILACSLFICFIVSIRCDVEQVELDSKLSCVWYDLDWSVEVESGFLGLNEIFLDKKNDTLFLYETFSFGVPAELVEYSLVGKNNDNTYRFYSAEYQKYLMLNISKQGDLIVKRPLLNVQSNEQIKIIYLKAAMDKQEMTAIFTDFKYFKQQQSIRQKELIYSLAKDYHNKRTSNY